MAWRPKSGSRPSASQHQMLTPSLSLSYDDDDFQSPVPATALSQPLKPSNASPLSKKPRPSPAPGKENAAAIDAAPLSVFSCQNGSSKPNGKNGYFVNSIESKLLASTVSARMGELDEEEGGVDFELGTQLNELIGLCSEDCDNGGSEVALDWAEDRLTNGRVECPLCGTDISDLSEDLRHVHTNECLDRDDDLQTETPHGDVKPNVPQQSMDTAPVVSWLHNLGLSRFEEAFIREEIDWDTLQWLTEEDLLGMGITALGPRKKIVNALNQLKKVQTPDVAKPTTTENNRMDENSKLLTSGNKLITEFFQVPACGRATVCSSTLSSHPGEEKSHSKPRCRKASSRARINGQRLQDIPPWCCIPGTPFRVDAFRYLRGGCMHWFLTHFHLDHYQGLTRVFCHGKIYCSSVTARLVNAKIGVPWDRLQVLPLNEKISIAGIGVTCLDANHCPGSIIILFETPNNKAILHTGDFRFCEEMVVSSFLQSCHIHTLILDTTYCNPKYDFPKQEAVIQFVVEAIQAETFNPKTLFLIGTYTIGKERLFLEVARFLHKKIYVGAAKLKLLECLGIPDEDMQWFTLNEHESNIHVVPMWTIASFKRMKHISNRYLGKFNQIVAFSPTGWTYGKGKKKTTGRRWQQGTVIRYEVPYSEHCSFTELREFVKFLSPEKIIPSVNNDGPESADAMVALLTSDSQSLVN